MSDWVSFFQSSWRGGQNGESLSRVGEAQITKAIMDEGLDKNSVILGTTEIIDEFLLPLMGFALSIGRAAAEMGSEARFTGRDAMGKLHFLQGGQLQGWDSSRPLFTTDEFSPFVTF